MSDGAPNRTSDQQLRRRIIIEDRFVVSSRGVLCAQGLEGLLKKSELMLSNVWADQLT